MGAAPHTVEEHIAKVEKWINEKEENSNEK